MFTWQDKLHVLMHARYTSNSDNTTTPPMILMVWDGVNPPTYHAWQDNGNAWGSMHFVRAFDPNAGILHWCAHQEEGANAGDAVHWYLDLNDLAAGPQYVAKVNEQRLDRGAPRDAIVLYDDGDVTAALDDVDVDMGANTSTLTYRLHTRNPANTATLAVEFHDGTGWLLCDNVADVPADGTDQTFVHDWGPTGDDVDVVNTPLIQYRIRILSQTRE